MPKFNVIVRSFILLLLISFTWRADYAFARSLDLRAITDIYDQKRDRHIPVSFYLPGSEFDCSNEAPCPVALLNAGYGVSHLSYRFLAETLSAHGYLTIAIGHELQDDPPLAVTGNLYETRAENWQRGANTLAFVLQWVHANANEFKADEVLLIVHSNGGDIASWYYNKFHEVENNRIIGTVITLDHRRVPLPRSKSIDVLSIRASDYPADSGVLPSNAEQQALGHCVTKIANARHNDMSDQGPGWLKAAISRVISSYLAGAKCKIEVLKGVKA